MILRRLLLNAVATEGGDTATATPPASKSTPAATRDPSSFKGEFKMDDVDDAIFGGEEVVVNPTAPKEVEPKVEPKTEDKPAEVKPAEAPKPEAKVEAKPTTEAKGPNLLGKLAPKKTADTRDYTGFSEQESHLLKNMSREAYDVFSDMLRKSKTAPAASAQVNQNQQVFQHPDAYILHPEYKKLQSEASYAKAEGDVWMGQLMAAQRGEDIKPLLGVNKETGQFIFGDVAIKPTIENIEMMRQSMQKCRQFEQNASGQLSQLPAKFQGQVQNDMTVIQQTCAKHFDWVANPALLDHELDIPNLGKRKISQIRSDFLDVVPAYMRQTPGFQVAAELWVAMQLYQLRLNEAESGKAVAETIAEEKGRVEPTATTRVQPGKSKYGVGEFNMDGLPE